MRRGPLPSRRNTALGVTLYLFILVVIIAVLRVLGRGWIGAITAGLILTGVFTTLLVLARNYRRRT